MPKFKIDFIFFKLELAIDLFFHCCHHFFFCIYFFFFSIQKFNKPFRSNDNNQSFKLLHFLNIKKKTLFSLVVFASSSYFSCLAWSMIPINCICTLAVKKKQGRERWGTINDQFSIPDLTFFFY